MKKILAVLILATLLVAPVLFAEETMKSASMGDMGNKGMMKMYQCSMDGYTSDKPGKCAKCGMNLSEKEMTADQAQAALKESKESK